MNKKEGIKNNFQSLLEKEYYRGIIDLLVLFQTKGFGLRQAFFRYALMDDPKLGIDMGRKIKDFLKERDHSFLSAFVRIKSQYSGCVSSRQHLTNYLTMLREKKIVKRVGRFPDIQYKLTSFYYNELQRMYVIEKIERWNNNEIGQPMMEEQNFNNKSHSGVDYITAFGLQDKGYTAMEKRTIEKCWNTIRMNARNIIEIKWNHARKKYLEMKDQVSTTPKVKSNGMWTEAFIKVLQKQMNLSSFDFYYIGSLHDKSDDANDDIFKIFSVCPYCKASFKTEHGLHIHLSKTHSAEEVERYEKRKKKSVNQIKDFFSNVISE